MDKIIIHGQKRLSGSVPVSGAKNSALTLLPCALLTDEPLTLRNLPRLADIDSFQHLMNQFGVSTTIAGSRPEDFGRVMTLAATRLTSTTAPYELVRKMRASILVLGPMLARAGEATVSLPGGCAIGNRPIDLHLKALEAFGATIELAAGYVRAIAPDGGMRGGRYTFPVVSVGATENALMAASLVNGTCVLHNAAREPRSLICAICWSRWGPRSRGSARPT
jgi:UDP-N-acetylglucosamine 1-carboxyvinyltransferase